MKIFLSLLHGIVFRDRNASELCVIEMFQYDIYVREIRNRRSRAAIAFLVVDLGRQ